MLEYSASKSPAPIIESMSITKSLVLFIKS